MKTKTLIMSIVILLIAISAKAQVKGTFKDVRDGKVYKTVKIGNQTWMAQNLAYKNTEGCWAYNNDVTKVKIYGYLYDWKSAKKAVPKGWHLPSDAELTTLITYLGGIYVAGGKMKKIGTTNWKSPNAGATNSSGFTALPGGYRDLHGKFYEMGELCYFWTSTEISFTAAWYKYLGFDIKTVGKDKSDKTTGYSVRCIKD